MQKTVPAGKACYCINLRRAANILTKFYDQAFEPIHLTTNQFSLLFDVHALKSCNKSELAQHARLDRTTIIRSLDLLLQKNLVREIPGENNRNKVIQLTEAGEAAVTEGLVIWKQVQKKIRLVVGEENEPALNKLFADIESLKSQIHP